MPRLTRDASKTCSWHATGTSFRCRTCQVITLLESTSLPNLPGVMLALSLGFAFQLDPRRTWSDAGTGHHSGPVDRRRVHPRLRVGAVRGERPEGMEARGFLRRQRPGRD